MGEDLLFDMHMMQTPDVPHVEYGLGGEAQEPGHLAAAGPPPPPQGYDPQGVGYMATGPTYLMAAQEVPFAPVYPRYLHAGQVSRPHGGNQGLKPPKWNEEKQALAKWLQEIIMYFKTTIAPRQQWGWIALHTLDEAVKQSLFGTIRTHIGGST